jgi:hypothetical protein
MVTDEHTRLHRELEALRAERGLVKGDKPFDSAFNHRTEALKKSPAPAPQAGGGEGGGEGGGDDGEGGAGEATPSKVKFRSPR